MMKASFQPAVNGDIRKSILAAIMLSILLVAAIASAFANNVLGVLGLLAAPFWLPLCCYYVPLLLVKIYFGISVVCLLISFPLILIKDLLILPQGHAFFFGLASLMVMIGSSLGLLVAYSRKHRIPPRNR